MTKKILKSAVLPMSLCATSVALGQGIFNPASTDSANNFTPVSLEPKPIDMNHISMGFQLGFNIKASFKHIGKFGAATNPGSTNGISDHFYDDGYNLVDSTGNSHFNGSGFTQGTWNWGYGNMANQVHNNGGENGTIDMHSTSSAGGTSGGQDGGLQPGFELTFGRELFRDEKDRWRAGVEWSFGYTDYSIKDSRAVNAKGTQLTDSYSLFGNTVPTADNYSQDAGGAPNHIIIGDTPTRSSSSLAIPVSGTRKFDANILAFKLGPYFEIPLNKTFSLSLEGGVALVCVYSKFQLNEVVNTPSGLLNVKGSGTHGGIQAGGYIGAKISAALSEKVTLFMGAQFQDVGSYVHRNHQTGESAVLDLSQSVFFTSGVGYSF